MHTSICTGVHEGLYAVGNVLQNECGPRPTLAVAVARYGPVYLYKLIANCSLLLIVNCKLYFVDVNGDHETESTRWPSLCSRSSHILSAFLCSVQNIKNKSATWLLYRVLYSVLAAVVSATSLTLAPQCQEFH